MTVFIAVLLVAAGIFFLWRVLTLMGKYRPRGDPAAPVDGDTGVREPVPHRPQGMSGVIALEEPDDDEGPTDAVSRRR